MVNHNSWEYCDDTFAVKKADITVFRSGESGIPIFIRSFFNVGDIDVHKIIDITLHFKSLDYKARLFKIESNNQTKMDWCRSLTVALRDSVPDYRKNRNYPYMIFKKIDNYNFELELVKDYKDRLSISFDVSADSSISDDYLEIMKFLRDNYSCGVIFNSNLEMMISGNIGEFDKNNLENIKQNMFMRKDSVYFFSDNVMALDVFESMLDVIRYSLNDYGLFDVSYLYEEYKSKFDVSVILDIEDLADYLYKFVDYTFNIVSYDNFRVGKITTSNKPELLEKLLSMIENFINLSEDGILSIDQLNVKCPYLSEDFIEYVLSFSKSYIKTDINGTVYYQTKESIILPEDIKEIVTSSVDTLELCCISVSEVPLNTALSLFYKVNFITEYCDSDSKVFRKVIQNSYNGVDHRWRRNVFESRHV